MESEYSVGLFEIAQTFKNSFNFMVSILCFAFRSLQSPYANLLRGSIEKCACVIFFRDVIKSHEKHIAHHRCRRGQTSRDRRARHQASRASTSHPARATAIRLVLGVGRYGKSAPAPQSFLFQATPARRVIRASSLGWTWPRFGGVFFYRKPHSRFTSASTRGLIAAGILPSMLRRSPLFGAAKIVFAASNICIRAHDRIASGASSQATRPISRSSNSSLGRLICGAPLYGTEPPPIFQGIPRGHTAKRHARKPACGMYRRQIFDLPVLPRALRPIRAF